MDHTAYLDTYSYALPEQLIASKPAHPRDSSRLLVVKTNDNNLIHSRFKEIITHIPKGSLLVLNETKVVPARIKLRKNTGGKVEILFYVNTWDFKNPVLTGIASKKIKTGNTLYLEKTKICSVIDQKENLFTFKLSITPKKLISLLNIHGLMPIPKYMDDTVLSEHEKRKQYQTIFAKKSGSIAAPTASLHFTPSLFKKLKKHGIETATLTLHVGAGTFAPLTEKEFKSGILHKEFFSIPKATVRKIIKAKRKGTNIIAVGTTTLRTLESITLPKKPQTITGHTEIFIKKPFVFNVVNGLITNFHIPRSSLLCLVDAFIDSKNTKKSVMEIYKEAIDHKYRFYSFGDAMLIL